MILFILRMEFVGERYMSKVPARYYNIVFAFFMSGFISALAAMVTTLLMVGFTLDMPVVWLFNWGPSCALAFPVTIMVVPVARRISDRLVAVR